MKLRCLLGFHKWIYRQGYGNMCLKRKCPLCGKEETCLFLPYNHNFCEDNKTGRMKYLFIGRLEKKLYDNKLERFKEPKFKEPKRNEPPEEKIEDVEKEGWKYKIVRKENCTQFFKKVHNVWDLIHERTWEGSNWTHLIPLQSIEVSQKQVEAPNGDIIDYTNIRPKIEKDKM